MPLRSKEYVLGRLDALRNQNGGYLADRARIKAIMNGGTSGIEAIMAWDQGKGSSGRMNSSSLGTDLPAVNMMASGVERLAQQIGVPPTLKMPYGKRDSAAAREAGELRERIVEGWDSLSNTKMMYPQWGRWLPGYAFAAHVIRPRKDPVTGQLWPHIELRDPFDTWPGYFGVSQQPVEVAFRRAVPVAALEAAYPDHAWAKLVNRRPENTKGPKDPRNPGGSPPSVSPGWEGQSGGVQVLEYYDDTGNYVCVPEFEILLDAHPNILETGPMFHVSKRFSFDRLVSQYHHIIGLVAMMAKLNVLSIISAEDSTFKETNIIGDLEGNTYERGRFAVNYFEQGTTIDKPTGDSARELYLGIDRLERQLRIGAAYDAGSDSIAARGGFITGEGQRELRTPADANVNEYQKVIADGMETLDTRRLEWEEKHEKSKSKRVFWIEGDRLGEETYVPSEAIGGNWRSRRVYGMMAAWDESSKIVGGLQLVQGGIIDILTMQENLHGLDNVAQINQRINQDRARKDLFAALEQMAAQGDPRAAMALVEIMDEPDKVVETLKKFFTPQEPQMSPEEAAMAAMQNGQPGQPGMELPGEQPTVQTVLAEMSGVGATRGGAQTVSVNR